MVVVVWIVWALAMAALVGVAVWLLYEAWDF